MKFEKHTVRSDTWIRIPDFSLGPPIFPDFLQISQDHCYGHFDFGPFFKQMYQICRVFRFFSSNRRVTETFQCVKIYPVHPVFGFSTVFRSIFGPETETCGGCFLDLCSGIRKLVDLASYRSARSGDLGHNHI